MASQDILYRKEDGIATITFNRPERMNAVTDDMLVDLTVLEAEIAQDNEVRAVIVTGNGRAFCAGTDVSILGRDELAAGAAREKRLAGVKFPDTTMPHWAFLRIPKPTIAAVNGAAVGMGVEWTVQCDIRIASENARFGWVHTLRAIVPDTGAGPYLLPHIVGVSKACELIYSGKIIDAREAERIGLVSQVVPAEQLIPAARELARELMQGAPLAIKGAKQLIYGGLEWSAKTLRDQVLVQRDKLADTEDRKEGAASFREKRAAVWKGR